MWLDSDMSDSHREHGSDKLLMEQYSSLIWKVSSKLSFGVLAKITSSGIMLWSEAFIDASRAALLGPITTVGVAILMTMRDDVVARWEAL